MSYLSIELDDPRASKIADVISNKTCKKILILLSEKEMSEGDISRELKIPMNTVGYNIKKLIEAELIQKSLGFHWSVKGKKINRYKVSNKKILISPKQTVLKGILPAALITALIAGGIKFLGTPIANNNFDEGIAKVASDTTMPSILPEAGRIMPEISNAVTVIQNEWAWFLLGALIALFIVLLWNWRKNE